MISAILIIVFLMANVSLAFLIYRRASYQKYLQEKATSGCAVCINGEFYCIVRETEFRAMQTELRWLRRPAESSVTNSTFRGHSSEGEYDR